jgi:hypothetical protein
MPEDTLVDRQNCIEPQAAKYAEILFYESASVQVFQSVSSGVSSAIRICNMKAFD